MKIDDLKKILLAEGFYVHPFNANLSRFLEQLISIIYVDGIVFDNRDSIFGLKFQNEKLLIYFTDDGQIVLPFLKKIYSYDVELETIIFAFSQTIEMRKNDDSIFKLKANEQKAKSSKTNSSKQKKLDKSDYIGSRREKIIKFYKKVEKEIIKYIVSKKNDTDTSVSWDDLCFHFNKHKKKTLFKAIKFSDSIYFFPQYIECFQNFVIYPNELQDYEKTIIEKFKYNDELKAKNLFNETKNAGLLSRNGIDDHRKLFYFISKTYRGKFYFYPKNFLISLEKKECEIEVEEFSIDEELKKLIEIGDIN